MKPRLWMGGSPCSGKSSIATLLAERYDLALYPCDAHFDEHQRRATPQAQPRLHRLGGMTWDEIWMRPVDEQVADEFAIYREQFPMILDDLRALPTDRPVLVEGAALLPELVAAACPDPARAIWIVPTPEFQWAHYSRRGFIQGILAACSSPQQAFANWMERDIRFGEAVAQDARARGYRVISVDGHASIAQNAAAAAAHCGLA
jgi:2-phosphoglycerate kinase